jgi:lipopolysaccharide/colanic/teichoic acid biosynthesis glycosyltransferase
MLYDFLKRCLDIVVAIVALIVFAPVYIVFGLAVKFDGTGGGFFTDISTRIGKNKKHFFMLKFRSMVPNAHVGFWEAHPELKN